MSQPQLPFEVKITSIKPRHLGADVAFEGGYTFTGSYLVLPGDILEMDDGMYSTGDRVRITKLTDNRVHAFERVQAS